LVIILIPGTWLTLRAAQRSVRTSRPTSLYAGASQWLRENTPTGEQIFQTDWDDFPRLFYYNTHNTYLVGLDPTYLQLYDADLYDLWVDITDGDVENPSAVIRDTFGSRYVMTDLNHTNFINRAEDDPGLEEVYRDQEAIIFALK
jgi:hypothetical protein